MGEKINFSTVDKVADDSSAPFKRESALAGLSSISVSSGFYFTTFALISFLATSIIGIIFYFSFTDVAHTSEVTFRRYATDMLSATSGNVQTAAKTYKFANLNLLIKNLVDNQGIDQETRQINEIFYLDKKGKVLAHTDLTKVTTNANSLINRISSVYNNELFHAALMLPSGEVNIQPYPYQTFNRDRSFLYLFKYLLPRDYFDAMDYSIPVYNGRMALGTFHFVINRTYTDMLLKNLIGEFLIIWSGSIFMAALIALLIKLPVQSRMKNLNKFVQNYLKEDVNQYIEKAEKIKIREEMEYIDQKIAEIVRSGQNSTGTLKNQNTVKDAFLLKEN